MATFKAQILHFKADGTARVSIRLTHHRQLKYIYTDIYVTKADITKSNKIKSKGIQDDIDKRLKGYRDDVADLGIKAEVMSADELKEYLIKKNINQNERIDFIAYARNKIASLKKSGRTGTAGNYNAAINSLVRFLRRDTLDINDMTASLLRDYERWLLMAPSKFNTPMGRAISLYTSIYRTLINNAIEEFNDEDLGVFKVKVNPFVKYRISKPLSIRKRALDVEVIRKLKDAKPKLSRTSFARDMYLLSFYLVGMNSADLYKCTKFENGRITYNRAKTKDRRSDNAEISIKVEPEALTLLEKYKDLDSERVFCFYKMYSNERTFNNSINKGLKKLGEQIGVEDLEFYSARHSWATIAVNKCEIDKYTVHFALNHADENMKITDVYIKKDFSIIDKANRKVIDLLGSDIKKIEVL